MLMNVYHDGNHLIGKIKCGNGAPKEKRGMQSKYQKMLRQAFRQASGEASDQCLKPKERDVYIKERYRELAEAEGADGIDTLAMYDDAVYERFTKETANVLHLRKRRFERKAALNPWNYFVTITYDDKKMTGEQFEKRIRKTLSNFHTRCGWNYCAVFEDGSLGGRVHLHALMYVPEGQLHGTIKTVAQYSTKRRKMETRQGHSYFDKRFGNSDFISIDQKSVRNTSRYLTKYMTKTDTRIIYSRGVPMEIEGLEIPEEGIFMIRKTTTGFLAILADSFFGLHDLESEEDMIYIDLGTTDLDEFMEEYLLT